MTFPTIEKDLTIGEVDLEDNSKSIVTLGGMPYRREVRGFKVDKNRIAYVDTYVSLQVPEDYQLTDSQKMWVFTYAKRVVVNA